MKMIHVYNSAYNWFMMTVHVIIWNLHNGCFTLICTDGVSGAPAQSGLEQHDDDRAELTQPENVNIGDDRIPAETAGIC